MTSAAYGEPGANDLELAVQARLSSLNAVFTLSLILTQATSPEQMMRLVTTGIPSIVPCQKALAWHPSRSESYYERAPDKISGALAGLTRPGWLEMGDSSSWWAFPLTSPPGPGPIFLVITGRESWSDQDVFLLSVLAQLAGTVIAKLELIGEREKAEATLRQLADGLEMQVRVRTQELEESRARIVTAGDEVRRRIERDLHDGAQQRLVSLALQLRAAQAAAPPEAYELAQRLEGVVTEVTSALEELRETAHGLHPAILTQSGLRPALKALARRSAVPLRLDIQVAGQLPEPVEIAAYYAVSEALTNAAKHGHASAAEVEVTADDGMLRVCVRDDGRGGAEFGKGSGLVGLKDRIEALGGRIWLQSPPGAGTAVQIALPLEGPGGAGSPGGAADR